MFIVLNTMVFYTFILVIIRRKEFIGQRRDDAAPLNRVVVDDEIRYRDQLTVSAVPTFYSEFTAIPGCHSLAQARKYPDLPLVLLSHRRPHTSPRPRKNRRNNATFSSVDNTETHCVFFLILFSQVAKGVT